MKIGQFLKKMVGGSMVFAALACPMFTSCYNDAALWEEIEGIHGDVATLEQKLAALEAKLNTDLKALQTILEGQISQLEGKVDGLVTVKAVTENADGSVTVTLSDNTEFTVHPKFEQDYSGLVTTTKIDGVLYWAIYDENGKPVAVTDADGDLVPVVDVVPQVRIDKETALVEISFDGGITWMAISYNEPCVFENAEIVYTDNYTDEQEAAEPEWCVETPLYVVLTLADGSTITVTLDGAASFMFGNIYAGGPVTVQYIAAGETTKVDASGTAITDWVKEVPAGWMVTEDTEHFAEYGQMEFNITAPSAEAIASGAALAEGDLKVIAVAEGGKTITAKVHLTTVPFKTVAAGKGNLTVEMNNGLGGYLVGVSTLEDFDKDAILAELTSVVEYYEEYENWQGEMVKEYTWSPWYTDENETPYDDNYMDGSVADYPIDDLSLQFELEEGQQYVVWAVAINMWADYTTYTYGYTVGDLVSTTYLNAFIELDETATVVTFNSINITAEFIGVTEFYGGFQAQYPDYPTTIEEIVDEINQGFAYGAPPSVNYVDDEYIEGWEDGIFTGNPVDLVNGWQAVEPGNEYFLYLIPAVPGKTEYTVADVYWFEFQTDDLKAGGSIAVTAGEPVVDYKKITVPLSAEDAVYVYYMFVEPEMVSTIADKPAYLMENGYMREDSEFSASKANLQPGTTMTLLAMAVDQNGCYGEVFQKDYTSKEMTYASATVTAELQGTPSQTGAVKISSSAEVDTYYYWFGKKESSTWTNSSYFGGSAESASAFIALTPNSYLLKKVTPANLPADGIEMTKLTIGTPYVFVVSAKLTDGTYTKATVVDFTPQMDLGTFVYATDDNGNENAAWVAAKPTVTSSVDQVGDFSIVSWQVTVPEGYTAVTACFHEDYLTDYPSAKDKVQYILTYEYIYTHEVEAGKTYEQDYASKGFNIYTVVRDADGNYYETYVTELNLSGGFGV